MADYKKMYYRLFNSQTDAIAILQKAQNDTEDMYSEASEPELRVLEPGQPEDGAPDNEGGK